MQRNKCPEDCKIGFCYMLGFCLMRWTQDRARCGIQQQYSRQYKHIDFEVWFSTYLFDMNKAGIVCVHYIALLYCLTAVGRSFVDILYNTRKKTDHSVCGNLGVTEAADCSCRLFFWCITDWFIFLMCILSIGNFSNHYKGKN